MSTTRTDANKGQPNTTRKADNGDPKNSEKTVKGKSAQGRGRGHRRGNTPQHGRGGTIRQSDREGSFPYTTENLILSHGVLIGTYNRYFDRYRGAFYHVTSVLQRLELNEGIELIHEHLGEMLNEADTALDDAKKEILAALQNTTGSRQYDATAPNPQVIEARIPSFLVRRFLELFRKAEDYLDCVIYAESCGAISWNVRRVLLQNCPRYLTSVGGRFQSLATRLSMRDLKGNDRAREAVAAIVEEARGLKSIRESRPLTIKQSGPAKKTKSPGTRKKPDAAKKAPAAKEKKVPAVKTKATKTVKPVEKGTIESPKVGKSSGTPSAKEPAKANGDAKEQWIV